MPMSFVSHLTNILDRLGMSVHAQTDFMRSFDFSPDFERANSGLNYTLLVLYTYS
jgi:hypothetical protein